MRRSATLLILAAILSAMSGPASAAVHPWGERIREMHAALFAAQPALDDFIEAVEIVGRDLYRVRSNRCSVTVRIVDVPTTDGPGKSGSRVFRAEADKPACP